MLTCQIERFQVDFRDEIPSLKLKKEQVLKILTRNHQALLVVSEMDDQVRPSLNQVANFLTTLSKDFRKEQTFL